MAEQKEPIFFRENCPPSHPPHQHHQYNHHGNQEQKVGGFPNQYFTDVHCGVSFTEPSAHPAWIGFILDVSASFWDHAVTC